MRVIFGQHSWHLNQVMCRRICAIGRAVIPLNDLSSPYSIAGSGCFCQQHIIFIFHSNPDLVFHFRLYFTLSQFFRYKRHMTAGTLRIYTTDSISHTCDLMEKKMTHFLIAPNFTQKCIIIRYCTERLIWKYKLSTQECLNHKSVQF